MNPFQEADGAFNALPESLLGKCHLLQGLAKLFLVDILHRLLHLFQRFLKFRGIHLVEQLLKLQVLFHGLFGKHVLFVHLLDRLIQSILYILEFFLNVLILFGHLFKFLLLLPVKFLVLFQVLVDGFKRLLQLFGVFHRLLHFFQ